MPRLARLDAPGVLQHVIIRGIERRKIFSDNLDRDNFLARLATLLPETNMRTATDIGLKKININVRVVDFQHFSPSISPFPPVPLSSSSVKVRKEECKKNTDRE